ncbi:MAG: glycosyltransferase [Pirellulaceae bacterium]|nr:glycosyltransferase [Pirellulaceae bacterium]
MTIETPEGCVYRDPLANADSGRYACLRAQQLVAAGTAEDFAVSRDVCEACCRTPATSAGDCSPAVASLAYAVSSAMLRRSAQGAERRVQLAESRQFALSRLETAGPVGRAIGVGLAGQDRNSSADREHFWSPPAKDCPRLSARFAEAWMGLCRSVSRRGPRIGLVGRNSWQGLGYQNRELARQIPIDRWLIPAADQAVPLRPPRRCRVEFAPPDAGGSRLDSWLRGLELVLFIETPCFAGLVPAARARGIPIVCVANWEWLHPGLDWLAGVQWMLAPTAHTHRMLQRWQHQYGFGWHLHYLPWPIDTRGLAFRLRRQCRRILFINGSGGLRPAREDGMPADFRRKGLELVAEAAWLARDVPLVVFSQSQDLPPLPPHVDVRPGPADHRRLYDAGDLCLQPSHWEGLGLPLLECQAAGLPLITTDAAPMNEYRPWRVLPVERTEVVQITRQRPIPVPRVSPLDLAEVLKSVYRADISAASRAARAFVQQQHAWQVRRAELRNLLRQAAAAKVRAP